MASIRPEIQAAAKWWADQLRSIPKFDNGDPSFPSQISGAMAASARSQVQVPDEQIERFRVALEQRIEEDFASLPWDESIPHAGSALRTIGSDYGPVPPIQTAIDDVGIGGPLEERSP